MDSQKKTAVVTGSSSGIGRAISQDLLSHGYKVIGLARDHKKFDPMNKKKKAKSKQLRDKGKQKMEDFGLNDGEIENIFDLIEEEHPEL